jgi:hypothetical protein
VPPRVALAKCDAAHGAHGVLQNGGGAIRTIYRLSRAGLILALKVSRPH